MVRGHENMIRFETKLTQFTLVAMTRPKRCLIIVGDSETAAKGSKFLKRWMEFLEEHADLRYPDVMALNAG